MPAIRPRLSVLNALLLITIAAMAIVIFQLWRDVGPMRVELRELRNEVGRLSIEDDTKLHAIEVRTDDEHTWKWRVWIPKGQTVRLHSQWGNVPRKGVPTFQNTMALEPGEQWITLSAKHDDASGQWLSTMQTRQGSIGAIIQPTEHWFDWKSSTATSDGVSATTYVAPDAKNPVVLKRFRIGQVNSSADLEKSDAPTAGFIIWLDRQ